MRINNCLYLLAGLSTIAVLSCGGGEGRKASQEKPAGLETILAKGATVEKVTSGFTFDTAATPVYFEGDLYFTNTNFSDMEACRTMKINGTGELKILRNNNGLTSALQTSGTGTFYCCEMLGHRVIEIDPDGNVLRVVADTYDGKRIDGPNDLTVDASGGIYFTDSQFIGEEEKMQDRPAVYYVKSTGEVVRIIDDIDFPNGIELSPDGKVLYVIDTRGSRKGQYIRAYDVLEDCTVANGRDFAEVELTPDDEGNPEGMSGADGSAVDSAGNLYVATTRGLGVQVFSPSGEHLGNIAGPLNTNNISFGGEDLKTLYIAAKDGIYTIPVMIPGLPVPNK